MMPSRRLPGLMLMPLVAAVFMTGCASPPPPPPPAPAVMPASADQAADLQSQIVRANPDARFGHVAAVDSTLGTVAVAGIAIGELHKGDSLNIVDGKSNTVAMGTVIDADTTSSPYSFLIVKYDVTVRAPIKGDLAVYIPRKQ